LANIYLPNANWYDNDGVKVSKFDPSKSYGNNITKNVDLIKNNIPWFIR